MAGDLVSQVGEHETMIQLEQALSSKRISLLDPSSLPSEIILEILL
jgi:hypothetical protein